MSPSLVALFDGVAGPWSVKARPPNPVPAPVSTLILWVPAVAGWDRPGPADRQGEATGK